MISVARDVDDGAYRGSDIAPPVPVSAVRRSTVCPKTATPYSRWSS